MAPKMSSHRLNNGFKLQKTNRASRRWKQPMKKPFHRVSRNKILHDSWSISAALARGFSDHHYEQGEGPGDEVGFDLNGGTQFSAVISNVRGPFLNVCLYATVQLLQ